MMDGGIPLVSATLSKRGDPLLRIRRKMASDCYIALSHVWSDGLGNPNDNALPVCQIRRIGHCLQTLPHPHYTGYTSVSFELLSAETIRMNITVRRAARARLLWMDTLCIPVATGLQGEDINTTNESK
jgi:hypothetical protein